MLKFYLSLVREETKYYVYIQRKIVFKNMKPQHSQK